MPIHAPPIYQASPAAAPVAPAANFDWTSSTTSAVAPQASSDLFGGFGGFQGGVTQPAAQVGLIHYRSCGFPSSIRYI